MNNVKKMNLAKYLDRNDPYFGNLSKRDSSRLNNSSNLKQPINIDSKRNSSNNEINDNMPAQKPTDDLPPPVKKTVGGVLKRNNNTELEPITIEDDKGVSNTSRNPTKSSIKIDEKLMAQVEEISKRASDRDTSNPDDPSRDRMKQ